MHRYLPLTFLLIFSFHFSFLNSQKPWNDLKVMEENKLAPHTNVIPYADEESVDRLAYNESPWCRSLNGVWKFKYVQRPADIPKKFFSKKYDVAQWDDIRVPGNIEFQGFGVPVYVNMRNEFEPNPPFVPEDFNPVGCYVRDFEVPDDWQGRRVVVKFGAVKSAMKLYVNGKYVGYSEDGKSPAEFDITKYLGKGNNRMAVEVYRFCDGSYLECQDMWRVSGITRDVVIYSTPKACVTDYHVETTYGDQGKGTMDLTVYTQDAVGRKIEVALMKGGQVKYQSESVVDKSGTARFSQKLNKIKPWSEFSPELYTLVIRLGQHDSDGRPSLVGGKVGFRSIGFVSGQLVFNHIPMKIKGVNRHEHSAFGGQYVTREEMEEDIRMMKAAGINAVRTSHYPDDEYWYELCDRYGIYVMDEANNESHGQGYGANSLAKKPEWSDAMWYRINNMYMRDRNHPCVFAWSLANECGHGVCLVEAYKKLKALDKMRPVCNERANQGEHTDIVMSMYPSPQYLANYAREEQKKKSAERRPYITAEYCHAMGNSVGGLRDYWDTINKYPMLQGGFIWDWVDQSILLDRKGQMPKGNKKVAVNGLNGYWYALGGDLGALPGISDDDAFCANGLITSDRQPHEHYYEVAAVFGGNKASSFKRLVADNHKKTATNSLSPREGNTRGTVALKGTDVSVAVDTSNGYVVSYKYKDKELLEAPLRYSFWRPPTLNDLEDRNGVKCWPGLDHLQPRLIKSSIASNGRSLTLELLLLGPDEGYILLKELVDVNSDGALNINYIVDADKSYRTLPKLGVQLGLSHSYNQVEWKGNLYETYPDRRSAQKLGVHRQPTYAVVGEMHPVPQESGNHEASWVRFSGDSQSLAVYSSEKSFSFSVRDFDDSILTSAKRIKELSPAGHYVVNADYRQSGLGTATCGPGVEPPYLIYGDRKYNYRFTFVPSNTDSQSLDAMIDGQAALSTDTLFTSHVAPGKSFLRKVKCDIKPDKQYFAKFPKNMTDCRKGVAGDWTEQWSGFKGQTKVVFRLTLDSLRSVKEVVAGICNGPSDWVIAPEKVSVLWSEDGERWSEPLELSPAVPLKEPQTESRRLRYRVDFDGVRMQYLKLVVDHCGQLPDWHAFKGEPAWLMIDEIEVR